MPRKSKSTVMVPIQGKIVTTPKASATKVVIVSSKVGKVKNRRRKNRKMRIGKQLSSLAPLEIYKRCVADPFDCPPVRLGFDTFVPTGIHTAYLRGSFNTNTDGSFDIVVLPNISSLVFINVAGNSTTPFWTMIPAANAAAINSQIDMARVVSMGIRIFPQIPLTAAPGILSSGLSPRCSQTDFINFMGNNTFQRSNEPYNQFFLGRTGNTECNQVCWRPTDASEFQFQDRSASSFNIAAGVVIAPIVTVSVLTDIIDTQGSFLHISGQALNGSVAPSVGIFYEVVLHIETTSSYPNISSDTGDDSNPKVCNDTSISSLQSAYCMLANYLPAPSAALEAGSALFGSSAGQTAMAYAQHKIMQRMRGSSRLALQDLGGFVNIS